MDAIMNKSFKTWMLSLALLVPVAACDDDEGGDDSAGDSANNTGGGEEGGEEGGGMTSSSEESCQTSHICINDVCTCQTPGLEDEECADEESCVDDCEVCM